MPSPTSPRMAIRRDWNWRLLCSILINIFFMIYIGSIKYEDVDENAVTKNNQSIYMTNVRETSLEMNVSTLKQSESIVPVVFIKPEETEEAHLAGSLDIACHDRNYKAEILRHADYWVLKNYVRAEHGPLKCNESITYTTHADFTFLDNLIPLLERWQAPVSIALHAPGHDFKATLNSIKYLRDCLPASSLVRQYATFHIYFSTHHMPLKVPKQKRVLKRRFNCILGPPYANVSLDKLYKTQHSLWYPVNVGRNIARDAALTHYVLASDIELYPSPGLVRGFLEMMTRNEDYAREHMKPRVYPLFIFEVEADVKVPVNKTELLALLRTHKAIPFHQYFCPECHWMPKYKKWLTIEESDELDIHHIAKRLGAFIKWEPIYIGTNAEPEYEERLSWEGKSDKMTQSYVLCLLDYEFHVLDNAFLVHKPGIKRPKKINYTKALENKIKKLIDTTIYRELRLLYGHRKGCA